MDIIQEIVLSENVPFRHYVESHIGCHTMSSYKNSDFPTSASAALDVPNECQTLKTRCDTLAAVVPNTH